MICSDGYMGGCLLGRHQEATAGRFGSLSVHRTATHGRSYDEEGMDGCRCSDDAGIPEQRDLVAAVAELIEDLVGVLAKERWRGPDRAWRRGEAERMPTCRMTPSEGCSISASSRAPAPRLIRTHRARRRWRQRHLGGVERRSPMGGRVGGQALGDQRAEPRRWTTRSPFVAKRWSVARAAEPDGLAEPRPLALRPDGHGQLAVRGGEGLVRDDVRMGVPEPARRATGDEGVLGLVDRGRPAWTQQRHVDPLSARLTSARSRPARTPIAREQPGDDVADRDADLGRMAALVVGFAGDRHQARRPPGSRSRSPAGRPPDRSCRSR